MTKRQDRWDAHLARDRQRSHERRLADKALGRPMPAAVDRAIVAALQAIWREQVITAAGDDVAAQREASKAPISPWRIADRALEILTTQKRFDRTLAGRMISDRINPRDPNVIKIRRNALTADGIRDLAPDSI